VLRVTAHTNIIISGLNFNGNPRRILEMAEDGQIQLCISDEIFRIRRIAFERSAHNREGCERRPHADFALVLV
jgi:predicted nucleic acid-binding protein